MMTFANALEEIPVVDIHHLTHAGGALDIGQGKGRLRQHAVEIAQDRLCFVKAEAFMVEHGNAAEKMTRKVLGRLEGAERHRASR